MEHVQREAMEYDVVIVGAGPAGLAAAIRLKQLGRRTESRSCVLEKGSEVGAHILSGAVIDPIGARRAVPRLEGDGRAAGHPGHRGPVPVLGPQARVRLPNWPMPPLMNNHGNYIASLGNVCRWLAQQAEALGVEIYPGMAASEVLYREDGSVKGVVAGVFGIAKDGTHKADYQPGMELRGKYVFIAEGVRGSLAKELIAQVRPRRGPRAAEVRHRHEGALGGAAREATRPARCTHTMGWPLGDKTGGGSFMYHFEDNLVSIGFVVHLNYKNPCISPYMSSSASSTIR